MPDVIVVGGGAIGLSIAWRVSEQGAAVSVVDETPGRGASWAAAGMLAPITEVHYGEEALLTLNVASARMYPDFAHDLERASGVDAGYHSCGTLMVARDADDNAALGEVFEWQQRLGLDAKRLRGRECREIEPGLAPSTRGGILVADDHQVDNRALVTALLEACARSGVELVRDRALSIEVGGGRATGVRVADGRVLECATIVLAAGWRTPSIEGVPPEVRVVRPVKGQLVHLRARAGVPWTAHNVRGLDVYVVARPDGRVVVGATVEEKGDDTTVTAGGVHFLLDEARRLLPEVDELDLVESTAGLRPGTPDNAPLLGETSLPGLIAATGHFRNGILLAPVTAAAVARLVAAGTAPDEIAPFSPSRFGQSVPVGAR